MSSVSAPYGLRPAFHPSGTIRPSVGALTSGHATNIFQNSPVRIDPTTGDIVQAAAGSSAVGVFQGVEFTNAQGRRAVSNWWPANMVGTDAVVYYTQDPWIVYEIQGNGSIARTSLGAMSDWTALSGNTGTGLSTVMLNTASLSDSIAGLQIIGIADGPDNAWGDAFTQVLVQIAEHQLVAARPAFA